MSRLLIYVSLITLAANALAAVFVGGMIGELITRLAAIVQGAV